MHMNESDKNTALMRNLTLFFGGFLLFTDVFFLSMGIIYDMPIIRYIPYGEVMDTVMNS